MKLTMLGTGNALVYDCYNTCFVISDDDRHFMVDGGGGSGVLSQLKAAGIRFQDIHDIFVTHKHIDHILGIVWMIRIICQNMNAGKYEGEANIYAHDEVIELLKDMSFKLLQKKQTQYIGSRLHLIPVADGQSENIIGKEVTFFDIQSTKAKQYGFSMQIGEGKKLTCCGDEPYNECEEKYAKDSDWLLHEAFCLFEQADRYKPYEKNHSTAKDAAELAQSLGVKNLLLYHTEDDNLQNRKKLYSEEAKKYYSGNVFVPDDLDMIEL